MKKCHLLLACAVALFMFSQTSFAITIQNNNSQSVKYIITTNGTFTECSTGQIGPNQAITWVKNGWAHLCRHPKHVYVRVEGVTSSFGVNCTHKGSHNPRLKNDKTTVEVVDAGLGRGIHCWVK